MVEPEKLDNLLPEAKNILLTFINNAEFLYKYVFVDGSAISLYLGHRKSEDLDFFTYENSYDTGEILNFIRHFEQVEILSQTNSQLNLLLNGVKVTFFNAKWDFLRPQNIHKFNLASIEALAAMKVNTLFLRAKYRDYYDLYFIVKERQLSLKTLFELSQKIVAGLTFKLMASALIFVDDIEDDAIDHLQPVQKISKYEIRDFFQKKITEFIKK